MDPLLLGPRPQRKTRDSRPGNGVACCWESKSESQQGERGCRDGSAPVPLDLECRAAKWFGASKGGFFGMGALEEKALLVSTTSTWKKQCPRETHQMDIPSGRPAVMNKNRKETRSQKG